MAQQHLTADNEEVIDLGRLLHYAMRGFQRFWVIGLGLMLSLTAIFYIQARLSYVPTYRATASVIVTDSVSMEQTSGELTLAAQMGKTFSYIVRSDMLRNVVSKDLGLDQINSYITATAVSGTNLLTIAVDDTDAQRAYDVLNSVLKNYPAISDYVLGATRIEVVQPGQVSDEPINRNDAQRSARAGMLLGLALYIGIALIYAFSRKTAGNADDVREETGLDLLANIPSVSAEKRNSDRVLVTQKNVGQSFVESFRVLANQVERDAESGLDAQRKVYMITSTVAGEGKTTMAMNLALILSRRKKRVLLVDADLRGITATTGLGFSMSHHTLQTFLENRSSWQEAVQQYKKEHLYVLPATRMLDSAEVLQTLSAQNLERILELARSEFDYVIVDTPPLGILADAASIQPYCDGTLLVIRQDYAQMNDIRETISRLFEGNGHIVGFAMNRVKGALGNYGYGYSYRSYMGYEPAYYSYQTYGAYADAEEPTQDSMAPTLPNQAQPMGPVHDVEQERN